MTDDAWQLVQDMASLEASKRLSLTKVISSLEHLAKAEASIDDPDDEGMRAPEPTESSSKCTTDSVSAEENAAIIEALGLLRSESESTRYNSLQTLYRRAHSVSACRAIKQADGFRWVFHCLQDHCASLTQRLYACGILDQMICASELPGNESSRWRSLVGILPASLFTQLMETLASSHEDHVIVEALDTLCIVGNVDSWENGNKLDFIPPVTSLLRIGTPSMQAAATLALRVLVRYNEPAQLETLRCGAVMLLLNQLDVGTDEVKYHSARTLTHLAAHDTNAGSSRIIRLLMASAQNQRSDGSSLLALSMIGEQKYTQRDIVEAGVFPLIVKLIQTGKESEKTYAALSMGDFARGDMYTEDIIGAGGVEALLQLVQTGTVDEKESAIYALSCIAEFHERTRAVLMEPDVLRSIPALLRSGDEHARFGCVTWIERVANLDGAPPVNDRGRRRRFLTSVRTDRQRAR
ncbi:hypothetical protein Poli38472_010537 [Pythium oligandrum]|uniref:Uncharacterized protein n=1 Tax=Pythium oligandrum TaxID=41045 RepID=A0A8K1C3B5_PYTOL|nr:hypothetical protein Poli38472_010537 [Pythium oligandrum]|eukprot:TMW55655.1 hypothetical protein Poli38472_010537 [Pythium oligandrum]